MNTNASFSISRMNSAIRYTNGNVGIGTTSPSSRLDVSGTVRATGSTTPTSGVGLEMYWENSITTSYLLSYNRNTSAYQPFVISGNPIYIENCTTYMTQNTDSSSSIAALYGRNIGISGSADNTQQPMIRLFRNGTGGVQNSVAANILFGSNTANIDGISNVRFQLTSSPSLGNGWGVTPDTTVMTLVGNGYVGIGTTSPAAKLEVNSGRLRVDDPNNGILELKTNANISYIFTESTGSLKLYPGNTSHHVLLQPGGGNVGVGTVSPSYRLQVDSGSTTDGNLMITNTIGGGVIAFNDIHHTIWGRRGYDGVIDKMQFREYGQIEFWTGGAIGSQTQRMMISSTGNVGIGTSVPSYRLHVYDNSSNPHSIWIDGTAKTTNTGIHINAATGYIPYINFQVNGAGPNIAATATQLQLNQNSSTTTSINPNGGNVGIGTSNPSYRLDMNFGAASIPVRLIGSNVDEVIRFENTASGGLTYHVGSTATGSGAGRGFSFFDVTNASLRMIIASTGNVGIGTDNPRVKLDVTGGIGMWYGYALHVGAGSNWPNGTTKLIETGWDINGMSGDCVSIYTPGSVNGTSKINISSSGTINFDGTVGIGTKSPSATLHVHGSNYPNMILTTDDNYVNAIDFDSTNKTGGKKWRLISTHQSAGEGQGRFAIQNITDGFTPFGIWGNNIGIRGLSPVYPLCVYGYGNTGNVAGYAGWYAMYGWQNQTTSYNVSIYSQYFMMSGEGYLSVSDQRIKKDITDIDDGEALNVLRQIQPKRYRYIDECKRGTDYVYGFIAQQIRSVLPYATGLAKEFVPSVMTPATVSYDSENDITTVTLVDEKLHNFTNENIGALVRFFDNEDNHYDFPLSEIISANTFSVTGHINIENPFVYGVHVDDFHTLNKDSVFTVAVAALQEVDRELQTTRTELQTTQTELQSTRTELDALKQFLRSKYPGEI